MERERLPMDLAPADQDAARVVLDVQPLVKVEGERIRPLDAGELRPQLRIEGRQRAEGAVDVQPQVLCGGEVGERGEIVDRAGAPVPAVPITQNGLKPRRRSAAIASSSCSRSSRKSAPTGIERSA